MHVGHPGNVDIGWTFTRTRTFNEITSALPEEAPERVFFDTDPTLRTAFENGQFNCWGVPAAAEPSFRKTELVTSY